MSRRILRGFGRLLALGLLLIGAFLIGGFVIGGEGSVETPIGGVSVNDPVQEKQAEEEVLRLQRAKRWIEQEVKEEVLRLQRAKRWMEQEWQEAQKQEEEDS
jgi:hypothetical protein